MKEHPTSLYTKTGDKGMTSLVGGKRVSKCCDRLESYGTIDELSSHIGLLIAQCADASDRRFLARMQVNLFVVGGYLATDTTQHAPSEACIVTPQMVSVVESEIDRLQAIVPALRAFILPGGCLAAAEAHVCRTVCRRAERNIYRLVESGVEIDEQVLCYVNRLSDYFFVLARKLNVDVGVADITWPRT